MIESFVSVLITFLFFWAFLSFTAFLAARFVLETSSIANAVLVGTIPGLVVLAGSPRVAPVIVLVGFAVTDLVVIHLVYRRPLRQTILLTAIHYTVSVLLGLTIVSLVQG